MRPLQIKIVMPIALFVLFLSLQWFLVTQKSFLLGFIMLAASVLFFKYIARNWIFNILPSIWLLGGLWALYFFSSQIMVFIIVSGYLAILWLALNKEYALWQVAGILNVYFFSSLIWFFILAQAIDFIWGLIIIALVSSLIFLQAMLISRLAGQLVKIKNKNQIVILSAAVLIGLAEISWAVSFLPFGYFILGALFTAVFIATFNIIDSYYRTTLDEIAVKKLVIRNVMVTMAFVVILVFLSPWLPQK